MEKGDGKGVGKVAEEVRGGGGITGQSSPATVTLPTITTHPVPGPTSCCLPSRLYPNLAPCNREVCVFVRAYEITSHLRPMLQPTPMYILALVHWKPSSCEWPCAKISFPCSMTFPRPAYTLLLGHATPSLPFIIILDPACVAALLHRLLIPVYLASFGMISSSQCTRLPARVPNPTQRTSVLTPGSSCAHGFC